VAVNPIPDDYRRVTPVLNVEGASELIRFIGDVFDAHQRFLMPMPGGSVAHAELEVGDAVIMIADATPEYPAMKVGLHVYVEDTDATYQKALAAGAVSESEPQDMFYGDRSATVRDPWGNRWMIASRYEVVAEGEMLRRAEALFNPPAS